MSKLEIKESSEQLLESSRHLSVGVLGHVDHGKTSLVRMITGTNTDRLREEQKRGLSIVLGYAYLESNSGIVDFIDVPGHESFLRMMISGATGIDYVLLTIAADEGIKPQTEEHFNIAKFLGIKHGLTVITKTDAVSKKQCSNIRREITDFIKGTFLEDAPILETSILDLSSIDRLRSFLDKLLANPIERKYTGKCYLPFDRVFTMPGFGTVATGTLRNGDLAIGQKVEIMPNRLKVKIRQMQVHNKHVNIAHPGERVSVNIRNISKKKISRGDALVAAEHLHPTRLLDAEIQLLDGLERIPRYAETVRILFGTCEVMAMMRVLGTEKQANPGATCVVQFSCLREVVVPVGERLIIRSMTPVVTIGGGRILDNSPKKHRRSDKNVYNRLLNLASNNKLDVVFELIQSTAYTGINVDELISTTDISIDEITQLLNEKKIIRIDAQRLISKKLIDELSNAMIDEISIYHADNPSRPGQPISEFRSRLHIKDSDNVFQYLISQLVENNHIKIENSIVRLSDFDPFQSLSCNEKKISNEILEKFKSGGLKPPELDEVIGRDSVRERVFHLLKESGELIPVNNRDINRTIVFHRTAISKLISKLEQVYADSQTFTVADVRKLVDTSRKFAIPLLEYLDSERITIRVGDKRKLLNH